MRSAPYPHASLELARQLEATEAEANSAFVEVRRTEAPDSGADWIDVAGARAMYDGPESPLSQSFGLGLFAEITEDHLDTLEAFFHGHRVPAAHEVCPLAGPELGAMLALRGYVPVEHASVLYRPVLPPLPGSERGAGPWRVTTATPDDADDWAELAARGWSDLAEAETFMRTTGRLIALRKGSVALFAELDGRRLATGALSLHGQVALFAGASTLPSARGQGAQTALLTTRLELASQSGCTLAAMVTQPGSASQRNAERAGFRVAYTRTKWVLEHRKSA